MTRGQGKLIADTDVNLLEVEDLQVQFDTPAGIVRAVDGVSLSVAAGQTLGIVGESGSGKSVLARAIMDILGPSARLMPGSRIAVLGRNVDDLSRKERRKLWGVELAMVFQDPMTSLTPVLTIGKQITQTVRHHDSLSRTQARARAVDLLRLVGIPEPERRLRQYPHHLSGGMRQRVSIALALACTPRMLIADEPTTALDVSVQHQILELLDSIQEASDTGMILITHDLGVVAARTDEIAVMYAGQIVEKAPTRTLFKSYRHPYTRALLASIPRLSDPSHRRLHAISGSPPGPADYRPGCSFAARCPLAQPRCLDEMPELTFDDGDEHGWACFFPVGTPAGEAAEKANRDAGTTPAGLRVLQKDVS